MGTPVELLEFVGHQGPLVVDPEAAVVRGVKVLGLESANGRSYLRGAVKEALPLYEGRAVNIDHPAGPGRQTPVSSRLGWLESVSQDADGGMRGSLHLVKSHPWTPFVLEVAGRRPQLLGLSHNAHGRSRRENGREVIEAIDVVHSVDLVADPATVKGLHEGRQAAVSSTVKQLVESLKASRPGWARGLREAAEAGILSPDAAMDAPPDAAPGEGADHEAALKAGFKAAVVAVVDDDSLDLKAKLKRMRDILRAQEKLIGADDKGDGETDMASEESKKAAQGDLLEAERRVNKALRQINEKGVRLTQLIEMALAGCKSDDDVKRLVESLEADGGRRGQPPRSAAPPAAPTRQEQQRRAVQESRKAGDGADQIPTDAKGFARWLRTAD